MAKYAGVGDRVRERLHALGYWNEAKKKTDWVRFSTDYGYVHTYVDRWLKGQAPTGMYLVRLSADLRVPPQWLLGERITRRRPPRRVPPPKGVPKVDKEQRQKRKNNNNNTNIGRGKGGLCQVCARITSWPTPAPWAA